MADQDQTLNSPSGNQEIATDLVGHTHYQVVVLRDDQLELIREIVREEIRAAHA